MTSKALTQEMLAALKLCVQRMEENPPPKKSRKRDLHAVYLKAVYHRDLHDARVLIKKAEAELKAV